MSKGKEKLQYTGEIASIKKLEKVTLLNFDDEEIPTISFFTRDYDGNPQYGWLEEGVKYKIIYYKNGQYYNLLDVQNPNGTKVNVDAAQKKLKTTKASNYKRKEADRQTKIIRQSVLKVATELIVAENQHDIDNKDLTEQVIQTAETFEKWVNR